MPKLVTWMNNQRVGELTKLANGAHTFKYAPEWLANRYARPLSLSLPLQRGNITSDAVFNFFDNLLPDSPIVRDRIVKRYHAKSRQPFDLLSEIGRDSVGAVTLIPEDETVTHPIMAWEKLTEARLEEVLTAYKADIPLGMIREENDFRISVAGAQEKTALLRIGNDWCIPKGITPTTHIIKLPIGEIRQPNATLDLSQSVDNEYYCLLLAKELGLNVPDAEIIKAGNVRALAVERFDRRWNAERTVLLTSPYLFRLAAVIDSRHFTTSFQHFRYWVAQEYTSAISNWQWGLTHPKAKKRQSIKFIRDIFWRQQRC